MISSQADGLDSRGSEAAARGKGRLAACVTSAALSGLLFGFDTAVISGTTHDLMGQFALSAAGLGFTVSAALIGTLAGALLVGIPSDRYGSRNVLVIVGLQFLVGAAGSALAPSWSTLIAFRVLTGLAVGGASVLAPVYIAEIAPARSRGSMIVIFQLNIILGILGAFVSNAAIASLEWGEQAWRWKFGMGVIPALLMLMFIAFAPQSPRWLVSKGRENDARKVLRRLGRSATQAYSEICEIAAAHSSECSSERLSWGKHSRSICLAIAVAAFNQLSGINALLYYTNDIFAAAGSSAQADKQAIIIGLANGIFTIVGMILIDRVGRRPLLIIGSAGMAACLLVAGLALESYVERSFTLFALIGFIAFFASSTGAVIWVYLSEIFPSAVRSRGAALGASVHWAMNAFLAAIFPSIAEVSAGLPFIFFAAMMAMQVVVVARYFPETARTTLESIGRRFDGDKSDDLTPTNHVVGTDQHV